MSQPPKGLLALANVVKTDHSQELTGNYSASALMQMKNRTFILGSCDACKEKPYMSGEAILRCKICSVSIPYERCVFEKCTCKGEGRLYKTNKTAHYVHCYAIADGFVCSASINFLHQGQIAPRISANHRKVETRYLVEKERLKKLDSKIQKGEVPSGRFHANIKGACHKCKKSIRYGGYYVMNCSFCSKTLPYTQCTRLYCPCNATGRIYETEHPEKLVHVFKGEGNNYHSAILDKVDSGNCNIVRIVNSVNDVSCKTRRNSTAGPLSELKIEGTCAICSLYSANLGLAIMECARCSTDVHYMTCTFKDCPCLGNGRVYLTKSRRRAIHTFRLENGQISACVLDLRKKTAILQRIIKAYTKSLAKGSVEQSEDDETEDE